MMTVRTIVLKVRFVTVIMLTLKYNSTCLHFLKILLQQLETRKCSNNLCVSKLQHQGYQAVKADHILPMPNCNSPESKQKNNVYRLTHLTHIFFL